MVVVGVVIGSTRPSYALSPLTTTLTALTLLALQRRAGRWAHRIVYGEQATPYDVMAGFAGRMSAALSLEDVLPVTAEAAGRGLGARSATAGVILASGAVRTAVFPDGDEGQPLEETVDVVHEGTVVGLLGVRLEAATGSTLGAVS